MTIKVEAATLTIDTVEQFALETAARDKADTLVEVLRAERPDQAIVFVRTKIRCDQLFRTLRDRGLNVKALHGDMSQGQRDGVMLAFKSGRLPILVATDVAARGLDISSVTHVINYDVPTSPDVYVHRIGRTGRVGRSGRAITFYEPRQARRARGDRAPHEDEDVAVGEGRARRARPRRGPPAPPPQAAARGSPGAQRRHDARRAKLIASGGRAAGIEPKDILRALTASGVHGDDVRNVRVLERFALLDVPEADADRVVGAVNGTDVRGHELRLERARG